jgi:hypothetical protein
MSKGCPHQRQDKRKDPFLQQYSFSSTLTSQYLPGVSDSDKAVATGTTIFLHGIVKLLSCCQLAREIPQLSLLGKNKIESIPKSAFKLTN